MIYPDPPGLDAYQARLYAEAADADERSWVVASRPNAVRETIRFQDLRVGDYITSDGVRWAFVIDLCGPFCYVRSRQQGVKDGQVSVLFEIPEPVTVSGETHFWLDRGWDEEVVVDRGPS